MASETNFEREAIRAALVKMFQPTSYFDICTFDKCCKIAGVVPDARLRDTLSALHCVSWSDMTPTLRQEVAERVIVALSVPGWDLSALERVATPEQPTRASSFLRRLRA